MNWELDALCDDFEAALERGERPAISEWAFLPTAANRFNLSTTASV